MLEEFIQKNARLIGLLLLGLFLSGGGFLGYKIWRSESDSGIEILGEEIENATTPKMILVEIAGEVIKPGVYEMLDSNRVNDLLIKAGGMSAKADREWVSKNINLAQKLSDGGKIYIPDLSDSSNLSNLSDKINLNTASAAELDSLWGIGEATAKNIIAGRPYQRPEELLEKKIIKSNVWEKIKDLVSVY